jgi:HEAT repeat protein
MFNLRYSSTFGAFIAAAGLLALTSAARAAGDDKKAGDEQAKLIAVLGSGAAPADKALACKGLAIYGDQQAVPALAALLADEQLASWARIALQSIPGPAAEEALRQALGKLQGRLLIGVINTIAVRGDAKAADALIARLKDADPEVAQAAAVALGSIGGPSAVKALETALANSAPAIRSAVAEGCIRSAEKLQAQGDRQQAVKLFDAVRKADVPKQRIIEATRGAILAQGPAGVALLVEQLKSADKALFAIGLRVAQETAAPEVTAALVAELAAAAPERKPILIQVLANRGDRAALPAILTAAKNGPEGVRGAAVQALGRLGDASSVPVLLEAAMGADAALSETALRVLAAVTDKSVDRDVVERLATAEGKTRLVLIQLAGLRSIAAAVPLLLKAADDPNAQVRLAAMASLGRTLPTDDLSALVKRVAESQDDAEAAAAVKALGVACQRVADREACAGRVAQALASAGEGAKCRFLEVLAMVGGAKSLQTVATAAKSGSPEMQETASRMLGAWMDLDAAPVLLDLATHAADGKYKIRALRGYIRLLRQFPMADDERAKMCRVAMETAKRAEEKRLVLEVIGRYPHADVLPLVLDAAKIPALKNEAIAVAMILAEKSGGRSAELQKMLSEMGQGTVKIEILKAEYGAEPRLKDVTTILRKHVRDFPIIVLPSPSYNATFGGDPAPGVVKQLKVQYRTAGKPGEAAFHENATIVLPAPK